ncbi:MAG: hypothetical protein IPL46_13740 [Saprospiraceae bacterium]|nr:hypothetical protein [Saprospiraceae bacterium]
MYQEQVSGLDEVYNLDTPKLDMQCNFGVDLTVFNKTKYLINPQVFQKKNILMVMSEAVIREIDDSRRSQCAIMFTDILGFTSLMQKDEQKTILKLESHRKQLEILHNRFGGRIIQYYGDGSLSVFTTPVQALHCAVAIQENASRLSLPLKVGIHYGDIVEKGSAVYGDGINVASRIESVGIAKCILFSEDFWNQVKNKGFNAQSMGALRFKNITKPIKVFGLEHEGLVVPDKNALVGKLENRPGRQYKILLVASVLVFLISITALWRYNVHLNELLQDDITTVGVIPFRVEGVQTMDASLRSGFTENLVTHLSSFYGLQVLSSRSTEPYANSMETPTEIGSELGVSHLLYGTLRQGRDDSIRINVELVDVRNGRNIWAKSVNKTPEDFFANPIDISSDLTAFLEARENPYKIDQEKPTSRLSLTTFRLITEAREEASKRTEESFNLSNDLLRLAIARDSSLALGYALLSQNYSLMHAYGFMDAGEAMDQAEQNGGMCLYIDRNLAEGYVSNALMQYSFFQSDPEEMLDLLQQAVLLRPSYDYAYYLMGKIYFDLLDYEMAVNYFALAHKLNPDDFLYRKKLSETLLASGDSKKAGKISKELVKRFPDNPDAKLSRMEFCLATNDLTEVNQMLGEMSDGVQKQKMELSIAIHKNQFAQAEKMINQLAPGTSNLDFGPLLVTYYDKIGQHEKLWAILQNAVDQKAVWLKEIKSLRLKSVENSPEGYQDLLDAIKLIDVQNEG